MNPPLLRRKHRLPFAALLVVVGWSLTGCDVDTDEGDIDLPEYEQTEPGNLDLPSIDVEPPDVRTGTTTIEVPTVEIDPAEEGSADANPETPAPRPAP